MKEITNNYSFWIDNKWKNIKMITEDLGYDFTPKLLVDVNKNYIVELNNEYFVIKKDKEWLVDYKNFLKKLNNKLKLYM